MDLQEIKPFEGLGDVRFGTPRSAVRALLGSRFTGFRKVRDAPSETDAYQDLGLHLYYDQQDRLEFIEAFPPADPTFNEIHPLGDDAERVLQQLAAKGHRARYEDEGYNYKGLGFMLYVPENAIEAVSIYRRGYYDE